MLKVDLVKQLNEERKETNFKGDALNELKLLLEKSAVEERNILREAGLDFNIQKLETERGINLERSKFETQMKNPLFTESEIKKLCIKYDLRFLRSRQYKGTIEPILGASIIEFFKSNAIDGMNHEAANSLYILAPLKAFNINLNDKCSKSNDPILFYKMPGTKEVQLYALIHKWGNDFSIARRVRGFIFNNAINYNLWHGSLKLLIAYSITSYFTSRPLYQILAFLGAISIQLLCYIIRNSGDDSYSTRQAKEKYNEKFRKGNWNTYDK